MLMVISTTGVNERTPSEGIQGKKRLDERKHQDLSDENVKSIKQRRSNMTSWD